VPRVDGRIQHSAIDTSRQRDAEARDKLLRSDSTSARRKLSKPSTTLTCYILLLFARFHTNTVSYVSSLNCLAPLVGMMKAASSSNAFQTEAILCEEANASQSDGGSFTLSLCPSMKMSRMVISGGQKVRIMIYNSNCFGSASSSLVLSNREHDALSSGIFHLTFALSKLEIAVSQTQFNVDIRLDFGWNRARWCSSSLLRGSIPKITIPTFHQCMSPIHSFYG
jgi:hypothetical protein